MRQRPLETHRRRMVAAACGRVVEVGVGSGLDVPLFDMQVEIVFGINLSPRLPSIVRRRAIVASSHADFMASTIAIPLRTGCSAKP
jgi:hypothetical protein